MWNCFRKMSSSSESDSETNSSETETEVSTKPFLWPKESSYGYTRGNSRNLLTKTMNLHLTRTANNIKVLVKK